jgi:hypothetical protein
MIPSDKDRPAHERLLLELTEEAYHIWRHNPVTAAYLLYLGDQIEAFRTASADLLEAGNLERPDVIRGRLMTLRELQNLSLDDIRNFYRQEEEAKDEPGK